MDILPSAEERNRSKSLVLKKFMLMMSIFEEVELNVKCRETIELGIKFANLSQSQIESPSSRAKSTEGPSRHREPPAPGVAEAGCRRRPRVLEGDAPAVEGHMPSDLRDSVTNQGQP
jgi:hypothetical protein